MKLESLPAAMRLGDLMPADAPGMNVEVRSLAYDSRKVAPGALFFCVPGFGADGHVFAPEAVERGASALVVERSLSLDVPEVLVPSVRAAMGPVANRFYGQPSLELDVIGVTGTNGKTTTTFLLRRLIEAGGRSCGLLGTIERVIAGAALPALRTTPEAIDLQADLRAMRDGGDGACAMEVSSHALALGRADGLRFAAAIFTNLTQDHLDFHETMESYFQAKRRLFEHAPPVSVINVDDPYGRRLLTEVRGALSFSAQSESGDYWASDVHVGPEGSSFCLHTPAGLRPVKLNLPGRFNIANALAALAAAHALGGDLDTLVAALEDAPSVPGRLEVVAEGQPFTVLVDYAHTPDSLENALLAARETLSQSKVQVEGESMDVSLELNLCHRVICVFGAGGDRDRAKRPLMGAIAARLSDRAIVTSDNPRSEQPEAIIEEVLAGLAGELRSGVEAIVDRRAAIQRALEIARPGDLVLIAGKGHEQGQEFAEGRKLPFDDVEVARAILRERGARL